MTVKTLNDWEALRARLEKRLGTDWVLEPASVLAAVAAHRDYWKPEEVRVLLLAESHVWTQETELEAKVSLADDEHSHAPTEFVRLVYCLGYGESRLLSRSVSGNAGTWQFWKLLATCAAYPPMAMVAKGVEPDLRKRVQAKVELLEKLKARGVWLLDASPVALYRPGGRKPSRLRKTLTAAWEEYSEPIVREVEPRAVMVIGKMVHNVLGEQVEKTVASGVPVEWMYQPQAKVSAAEHAKGCARLREMVRRFGWQR